MTVEALVTVCTVELADELREWLPSARLHYPGRPLYVATDIAAEDLSAIATGLHIGNVHHLPIDRETGAARSAKVPSWGRHWDAGLIWGKLAALREVVRQMNGAGVLLSDCDVTFAAAIEREFHADVVFSPTFHGDLRVTCPTVDRTSRLWLHERDSLFNAGMLLTRSLPFCDWWIAAYEAADDSDGVTPFYEQTALDRGVSLWPVAYLDDRDNFGKWRFCEPRGGERSYHMHLRERAVHERSFQLKLAAQRTAATARAELRRRGGLSE